MRFVLVWLLTVGTGFWVTYLIGWLVGLLWAPARLPVYFTLAVLWALIGLSYAWTKLRDPVPFLFERPSSGIAKGVIAFVLSLAAAYSLSFAADMLFGRIFGIFPETVWPPIGTWTLISSILLYVSSLLSKRRVIIVMPWFVMGAYVLIGTIPNPYPHRYIVTLCLFAFAAWLLSLDPPHGRHEVPVEAAPEAGPEGSRHTPDIGEASQSSAVPKGEQPPKSADFWHGTPVRQRSPSQDREAMKRLPPIVPVAFPTKQPKR